jgi:GT2 family glycosyltransferase
MKTKLSIIILNYYNLPDSIDCLNSLKEINSQDLDISVYLVNATDKDSKKDSTHGEKLAKLFPHVKVLESDNLGFSGAHNFGTRVALKEGAEEIIWLNNDTTVHKDFAVKLHHAIQDKSIGVASPKIYFSKGREFHKDQYQEKQLGKVIWYAGGIIDWENVYAFHKGVDEVDRGQFDKAEETNFCTGCCFITRKEVFEKVGLFEEKTFLYYEDTDWSVRVRKAGFKNIYYPSSIIWHNNAGSTKGSGSDLHLYYQTRNRIHFGLKHAPLKTKLALIKESLIKLLRGNKIEKRAVFHAFTNQFGNRHAS